MVILAKSPSEFACKLILTIVYLAFQLLTEPVLLFWHRRRKPKGSFRTAVTLLHDRLQPELHGIFWWQWPHLIGPSTSSSLLSSSFFHYLSHWLLSNSKPRTKSRAYPYLNRAIYPPLEFTLIFSDTHWVIILFIKITG